MYVLYVQYIILVPIWYQYLSDNCDLDRRSHPITLTFVLVPSDNLPELLLSSPTGHVSQILLTISLTIRLGDTNLHEYPIRSNGFQHTHLLALKQSHQWCIGGGSEISKATHKIGESWSTHEFLLSRSRIRLADLGAPTNSYCLGLVQANV